MKSLVLALLGFALFVPQGFCATPEALDRPFLIGPGYPLVFRSTTFEPDRAFNLKPGEDFVQVSYTRLNTYVYSTNSQKAGNPAGDASTFNDTNNQGYSVYFDGEIDRRFLRWYHGFSENLELQLTYRDLRFIPGTLDAQIESFHKSLGLDNQGRDQATRDQLAIYIYDNQTKKIIFQITQEERNFQRESMTLGFKFNIRKTANEAIALVVSSNFNDAFIENGVNESPNKPTFEKRNFNDANYSLLYSGKFDSWALHSGFSLAKIGPSLLPRSPQEMYYFFLGFDKTLGEHTHALIQALEYTSPFPEDNTSTISADVREVSTGLRWILGPTAFELGLIENQSQGPQNIDIAFFSNFMFTF